MAVEVEVFTHQQPNRLLVCRLAAWVMRTLTGVSGVDAAIREDEFDVWRIQWGTSVSARVVELPPGRYEFADRWSIGVTPFERGIDLGKIFAVVVADAVAVLADGYIRDEVGLVGGGEVPGGQSLARLLRYPSQNEAELLELLKTI